MVERYWTVKSVEIPDRCPTKRYFLTARVGGNTFSESRNNKRKNYSENILSELCFIKIRNKS